MNFIESIVIDCKDNDFILKSYAFLELSLYLCVQNKENYNMMIKKRLYLLLLGFTLLGMKAQAQHVSFGPLHSPDSPREDWLLPGDTVYQDGKTVVYGGKPMKHTYTPLRHIASGSLNDEIDGMGNGLGDGLNNALKNPKDSNYYNNPISNLANSGAFGDENGYGWNGYGYGWGLHKGLNLSIDLSVFATFGKNAPHWGGFTQTINATYLTPLTKDNKLWMALGTYINNINYGSDNFHDGGVYGMLGYKFNEHWEAYVYGQVSVANNYNSIYNRYAGYGYGPYGYRGYGYGPFGYGMYPGAWGMGVMPGGYGMGAAGANVLGAGVRYTNKNFSIGVSVEGNWYNTPKTPTYYKQYDYPVK